MRRIYWTWAAGLLLKLVGASWDVSWHFRFLRETFSPPHVVNLVGELFVAAAVWHEYRHLEKHRRAPLLVVTFGMLLFLAAIPFDQWWHLTFGIDLTTWSPSHLMLFYGTAVAIAGICLLFLADLKHERGSLAGASTTERLMLVALLVLLAESFAFPLAYNEYSTVGAMDACGPSPSIDPALVAAARAYSHGCTDLAGAIFHGTPVWLYPLYSIAIAVFLGTLVRASLGPGWALVTLAGLSAERVLADSLIVAGGFPAAVLPFQYVAIGLALEAAWMVPVRARLRALAGALAGALAAYVYFVSPPPWLPSVPLDAGSWPVGLPLAALVALAAFELQARAELLSERVNDGPEWDRVTDWAREKWDGLRS
jgi:hypothetical protein